MSAIGALASIEEAVRRDRRAWAYICWNRDECDREGPAYLVLRGDEDSADDEPDGATFFVGGTRISYDPAAAANIIGRILAEAGEEFGT